MTSPFITFITPTYRRPSLLANCIESVRTQTQSDLIEHIVLPDHVGVGIAGMYARLPDYINAVHGQYVHILADDDFLVDPYSVEKVIKFAWLNELPSLIITKVQKGMATIGPVWPPILGQIDLGCLITRRDIWQKHVDDYGKRYEGDFDFANALFQVGYRAELMNILFLMGGVMRGQPELV